ncbi:hypothetical protein [Rhodococcus zopfii]|nr:hypothetical protein [Rhodococcus zopfii]
MPYAGGLANFIADCEAMLARDFSGFAFRGITESTAVLASGAQIEN